MRFIIRRFRLSFEQWGVAGQEYYYLENSENTQEYYYDAADGYGGNHAPVSTITVKWDDNDSPERKMERLIVQKWIALFS